MSAVVWLYLLVAVPYTLFVILYATVSRPRTTLGRSLLLSKAVIAVLSWNAVLFLLFGEYPGQTAIRVFVVGGAIVAGWTQLALLIREQQKPDDGTPRRRDTDRKERT